MNAKVTGSEKSRRVKRWLHTNSPVAGVLGDGLGVLGHVCLASSPGTYRRTLTNLNSD